MEVFRLYDKKGVELYPSPVEFYDNYSKLTEYEQNVYNILWDAAEGGIPVLTDDIREATDNLMDFCADKVVWEIRNDFSN